MSAHKINGNIFTELAVNEVSILRQTHQAAHLKITVDKKKG